MCVKVFGQNDATEGAEAVQGLALHAHSIVTVHWLTSAAGLHHHHHHHHQRGIIAAESSSANGGHNVSQIVMRDNSKTQPIRCRNPLQATTKVRLRFDGRSIAYQRSLRSQH